MRLFVKRGLFLLWIIAAVAAAAALPIGVGILLSGGTIPATTEWRLAYYLLLLLFAGTLWASLVGRRQHAKRFTSLEPILSSVMIEYAALPINRTSTTQKEAPPAQALDGLFFYGDDAVTDAVAADAVRALAPLRQYLEERSRLPDYSDSETSFQIKRVKEAPIWELKISMNDGSERLKYFYSPEGCTDALRNALFFPPRQVAPQWFI